MTLGTTPAEDALTILGRRIRQVRNALNVSVELLAAKAGVTAKTLGAIERGQTDPQVSTVAKIAAALEVGVGELFTGGADA